MSEEKSPQKIFNLVYTSIAPTREKIKRVQSIYIVRELMFSRGLKKENTVWSER